MYPDEESHNKGPQLYRERSSNSCTAMNPSLRVRNLFLSSVLVFYFLFCYSSTNESLETIFTRKPFHKLEGNSIQTLLVGSILKCCWKCQRFLECLSINIADQPNQDGLFECVLLKNESARLNSSRLYHHYTRLYVSAPAEHRPADPVSQGIKVNTSPVCFGTKNSEFGPFYITRNGTVSMLKLVHLSGNVTCSFHEESSRSNWGCGAYVSTNNVSYDDRLFTIITDRHDQRILPPDQFIKSFTTLSYELPDGFLSNSTELVFQNFTTPLHVTAGQEYRIWYGQDLVNRFEDNNEGTVCVDVYIYY